MKDSYNRTIDYARISIINSCNLKCKYCSFDSQYKIIPLEDILFIVKALSNLGIKKIRLTGGEPTMHKDLVEIIKAIKSIDGIELVGLTTNGTLLENKIKSLYDAGLDFINISIDALSDSTYQYITGSSISNTINNIKEVFKYDFKSIKINVVYLDKINSQEVDNFIELTKDNDIEVRFIEQMNLGDSKFFDKNTSSLNNIISTRPYLNYVGTENTATLYSIKGYIGKVGFIHTSDKSICSKCNKIRITSDLSLKLCLLNNNEVSFKDIVLNKDEERLKDFFISQLKIKPKESELQTTDLSDRKMQNIGG